MPALAQVAVMPFRFPTMELRIDVDPGIWKPGDELDVLYGRMRDPADRLFEMPEVRTAHPGLVLRWRSADGEYYVYVEDRARGCLAGYTVFNRLIEVSRQADRHLRAPHSRYAPAYQRRGIASLVYRWALDGGLCLLSGARQSPGAHALWGALSRDYPCTYVALRRKTLTLLGSQVDETLRADLHTRLMMAGSGWTMDALCRAVGMPVGPGGEAEDARAAHRFGASVAYPPCSSATARRPPG